MKPAAGSRHEPKACVSATGTGGVRQFSRVVRRPQPGLGREFEAELQSVLSTILDHPTRYMIAIDDIREASVSRFPYSVYYRVRGNVIGGGVGFPSVTQPIRVAIPTVRDSTAETRTTIS